MSEKISLDSSEKINKSVDKKHIARLSPQLYCEYHRRYTSGGREDILHCQSKYYLIFPRDLSDKLSIRENATK